MQSQEKTLLVVFEFDTLNGGENSMLAVLALLIKSQWHIKAALPCGHTISSSDSNTLSGRLAGLGIETTVLTTHHPNGTRKSQHEYRSDFDQVLKQHRPHVVLCNSLSTSRLCGPVTAQARIASAGYLRDIIKLSRQAVADVNQLDRIVAVSNATMNFHCAQQMDAQKIRVIHNGVDLDAFHPRLRERPEMAGRKSQLGILANSPVVLYVGQIGMRKGIDVLIESFGLLRQNVENAHLLIVGQRHSQKEEARAYEQDAVRTSTQLGNVHWLGRRSDVADLMAVSDVLLHPARQEPLGRVLLEAAASGLPIITTLVGGSPEILGCTDAFDLLCPKDDAATMAARVGRLLTDSSLRQSISRELRTMAVRRFNRASCASALTSLLEELSRQPQR